MSGKWHGRPPTRDEIVAELGAMLAKERQAMREAPSAAPPDPELVARIDRRQCAYDILMDLPREQWERALL